MTVPVTYIPGWIREPEKAFDTLRNELAWVHHDKVPRSEYYCSMSGAPYAYGSGGFSRTLNVLGHSFPVALRLPGLGG